MKRRTLVLTAVAATACAAMTTGPVAASYADSSRHRQPPGHGVARQVLAPGDGWGSQGAGTSGGANATRENVVTVRTRDQLASAVAGDTPKIVYVRGRIDANTDARGRKLTCADYARDGYTLEQYLQIYNPAVWGRDAEPAGPVEDARRASQQAQAGQITIPIGSNTTIVGLPGASITGASLRINGEQNVIIRGLTVADAYDCFPAGIRPTAPRATGTLSTTSSPSPARATCGWTTTISATAATSMRTNPRTSAVPSRFTTARWTSPTAPTW